MEALALRSGAPPVAQGDRSLMILDDDEAFLRRLARAMEKRCFSVTPAQSIAEEREIVATCPPAYAVVDLRLEDGKRLDIVEMIRERRGNARIVVLTGYGSTATAVAAVKIGATDYLAKPADANDVTAALLATSEEKLEPPENPMSADRVRWEHIHRIYELCDRTCPRRRVGSTCTRGLAADSGEKKAEIGAFSPPEGCGRLNPRLRFCVDKRRSLGRNNSWSNCLQLSSRAHAVSCCATC